ncbi:hypothetical protein LCGC14_3146480 [marine sediment metagenome]|uniref:Uncharacterized protein n=1 Tax=marine sediment metagenome TaxID=412755 RepID=A0A0F8VVD3_9ZZZZ
MVKTIKDLWPNRNYPPDVLKVRNIGIEWIKDIEICGITKEMLDEDERHVVKNWIKWFLDINPEDLK